MNLRIKFNTVIIICCAISFMIVYAQFKSKLKTKLQLEIESKIELVLKISNKIDESALNLQQILFSAEEILAHQVSMPYDYFVVFNEAINKDFQANIWQQEVIDSLKNKKNSSVFKGAKSNENGEFQIIAQSIKNKENTIIGAKIVTIYKKKYSQKLTEELEHFILILTIIFLALLTIINVLIQFLIIKPIKIISAQADQISRGQSVIEELNTSANDEISDLTDSFNRIIRSLKAAMKLLNN